MAVADSPVMKQYKALKDAHAGCLLFFRMGDFYELFGEDAKVASEVLQITLTKRRTAQEGDEGIPMCGVPYHAAEGYIATLMGQGFKVALAEQVESAEAAKARGGSSALVKREVVRVYTPGTLTEDSMLVPGRANYLAAVAVDEPRAAVAWLELSTGEVAVRVVPSGLAASMVQALAPGEVVVSPDAEDVALAAVGRRQVTVEGHLFSEERAEAALKRVYGVADVAGLAVPEGPAIAALGAVLAYAELTQIGVLPTLRRPQVLTRSGVMTLDATTQKNLELVQTLDGGRRNSVLAALDETCTGAGARLLAKWLVEPSADVGVIAGRQAAWQALAGRGEILREVRERLRGTGDVARACSRLLLNRGGPRDLQVILLTGQMVPELAATLKPLGDGGMLRDVVRGLGGLEALTTELGRALGTELPALVRDGGFIAAGYDSELDGQRRLTADAGALLAELEAEEQRVSGLACKMKYNKVWGYYLEVSNAQLAANKPLPDHWRHRQTTSNAQRFTTERLVNLERDMAQAGAHALRRELEIFERLVGAVREASGALLDVSMALATLDVLCGAAWLAGQRGWVAPTVKDGLDLKISEGRHPVVARTVADFVPNDADLSGGAFWLLTGPNMAGKSTFLRQVALLVIISQMGYPVPAAAMELGCVDQVFSRIGAADDLARGQSTFMVEMSETAQILSRATGKSLVILDEVGRGTATYDGLAIAWAVVEDLARRIGCRTLFATHYHELTGLTAELPKVSVHRVAVKEWKGDIVFLHKVEKGVAPGSFGVHVAKLAGLPPAVVGRADGILQGLLKSARQDGVAKAGDLSLFSAPVAVEAKPAKSAVEEALEGVDVDALSPRAALDVLYKLKEGLV